MGTSNAIKLRDYGTWNRKALPPLFGAKASGSGLSLMALMGTSNKNLRKYL